MITRKIMPGLSISWVLVGLMAFCGCSSTTLTNSWAPPDAEPITFRKMFVVCISKDATPRRIAEDAMVRQIQNAEAVASYTMIPDAELSNVDKVSSRIAADGFDGTITMRLLAVDKELTWIPENYPDYYHSGFRRHYRQSLPEAYDQGHMQVDDIVRIETNIYSVQDENLVWTGTSETFNPNSVESMVNEISAAVAKDLRKRGLLPE